MSKPTGQVLERNGKRGRTFAIRFRAYGKRQFVTLGTAEKDPSADDAGQTPAGRTPTVTNTAGQ